MEVLNNVTLFTNGFSLALGAWFLGMGFSKVVNMYKTITS